jgi:hypothetical protein
MEITIKLSPEDINLLVQALNSHVYWQLSDDQYRNNGDVMEPGSDDSEKADEIEGAQILGARLLIALGDP